MLAVPRSMPIFMSVVAPGPFARRARSWRRDRGTCARCSHTPGERGAHRGWSSSPSAASAARISEAPARRSPISTSAPWSAARAADRRVVVVRRCRPRRPSGAARSSHSRRSSKIVSWTSADAAAPGSAGRRSAAGGRWPGPGYGAVSMSAARYGRCAAAAPSHLDRVAPRRRRHAHRGRASRGTRPRCSHGAPSQRHLAAGDGRRDDERARPRSGRGRRGGRRRAGAGGPRPRWCRARSARPRRPSRWRKAIRSSTSGSCAAGRMVVWPSARVAASMRVLRAHDRDDGERHVGAAQPARRAREVVAVAVLDLGAQGAHRVDVQVDRPPADPVAAGVADDDPPEARQERPQQDEAGAHLGRRLERHEQPVDVARGDLVDVGGAGGRPRRPGRAASRP